MLGEPDVRAAIEADVPAITAIYRAAVLTGTGTFELEPPTAPEMAARRARIVAAGFPFLVATAVDGAVLGYAYAGTFRERPAYRFTLETSVYVDEAARGRGVGRALLEALIRHAEQSGFRQMVALIGDAANTGSIRLHAACGFARTGTMHAAGYKFDRWLDVALMQRALGRGASTTPKGRQ